MIGFFWFLLMFIPTMLVCAVICDRHFEKKKRIGGGDPWHDGVGGDPQRDAWYIAQSLSKFFDGGKK